MGQRTMVNGKPDGYFEWFRKEGTRMRSGYFEKGKPVGEWTTYDKQGRVVKVTRMKQGNNEAAERKNQARSDFK